MVMASFNICKYITPVKVTTFAWLVCCLWKHNLAPTWGEGVLMKTPSLYTVEGHAPPCSISEFLCSTHRCWRRRWRPRSRTRPAEITRIETSLRRVPCVSERARKSGRREAGGTPLGAGDGVAATWQEGVVIAWFPGHQPRRQPAERAEAPRGGTQLGPEAETR